MYIYIIIYLKLYIYIYTYPSRYVTVFPAIGCKKTVEVFQRLRFGQPGGCAARAAAAQCIGGGVQEGPSGALGEAVPWETNVAGWNIPELNGGFDRKITDKWI